MYRFFRRKPIFRNDRVSEYFPDAVKPYSTLLIVLLLAVICKILLDLYLKTKSGYLLRAAGDNDALVTALAKDQGNVKILGLALANGLTALAGCIFAQEERVFEISMGIRSDCHWACKRDHRNEHFQETHCGEDNDSSVGRLRDL